MRKEFNITMRKALPLCLAALLLCTACASGGEAPAARTYDIAPAGQWTDGTYHASSAGYGGDLAVSVTITDGEMSAIDAADHNETPDYGGAAIETMIPAMLDAQSVDVDSVSSATETSTALKDAVAQCLEEASPNEEENLSE